MENGPNPQRRNRLLRSGKLFPLINSIPPGFIHFQHCSIQTRDISWGSLSDVMQLDTAVYTCAAVKKKQNSGWSEVEGSRKWGVLITVAVARWSQDVKNNEVQKRSLLFTRQWNSSLLCIITFHKGELGDCPLAKAAKCELLRNVSITLPPALQSQWFNLTSVALV